MTRKKNNDKDFCILNAMMPQIKMIFEGIKLTEKTLHNVSISKSFIKSSTEKSM